MEFYTASLSAFRARCLACTISGFYALVPQLTSYSLKKHNNTNTSLFAMAKWLKEAMYCSVSAALMPFAGTTEQGLLQSISGYCSYLSVTSLQLIAVLAFFYCLSPPKPTQTVQGTEPGWQGTQQPVTATHCASSIPHDDPGKSSSITTI